MDLVTIAVTVAVLALTAMVFRRTLFGIAVRGAAEDFDAARLMGVRANRVISGAFAFAGFLAGVAAVLILMRSPTAEPTLGADWLLKAVIAAVIGGLGSFTGAVVGGLALGLAEVFLRSYLPDGTPQRLTDAFVFGLIALLFIVRPAGLFKVDDRGARMTRPVVVADRPLGGGDGGPVDRPVRRRDRLHLHRWLGEGAARQRVARQPDAGARPAGVHRQHRRAVASGTSRSRRSPPTPSAICAIPVATKAQQLPDLPFGLGDVHLGPLAATLVGVLAALALGAFVGVAVCEDRRVWPRR